MIKRKAPKIVTVITLTTISIVFWVFFSLYQLLVKTPDIDVPKQLLEPIDPTLDTNVLNTIQQRLFFEEGQTQPLQGTNINAE